MKVLGGCVAVHLLLVACFGSAWWVPDLTLVGMVLMIAAAPTRWVLASALAGGLAMLWAVRFVPVVFAGYLALGWGLRQAVHHWDAADQWVLSALVGLAAALLTGGLVWLDDLWSPAVAVALMGRVASTTLSAFAIRRVASG